MSESAKPAAPRRSYYSARAGRRPAHPGFDLDEFKRFFVAAYSTFEDSGLFQEWFGFDCVDAGFVPGKAGGDVALFVYRKIRQTGTWPFRTNIFVCDRDDLFDVIELLYDHASKGVDGSHHTFNDCGWHYCKFDQAAGQLEFREAMNEILADFDTGFELSTAGEILSLADDGLGPLLSAQLPSENPAHVNAQVEAAVLKFRRRSSTGLDRRDAVRDLADVLEYLREEAKKVLKSDDERDLFNLANNFGIRHHNKSQKTDYDPGIWLSWTFYYYLATIHACVRLIEKARKP